MKVFIKPSPLIQSIRSLFIFCIIFIFSFYNAISQDYFQQEVNYKISVTLNDTLHQLNAFEEIEYINNSRDTLHFIYIHLWPNAYSDNNTALAEQLYKKNGKSKLFNDPELQGYIDSLDFHVNGRQVHWSLLNGRPDIGRIDLSEPLHAGDTILITSPFRVKIPKGVTSRLGHIGQSYQISQWYPKPAVYDQDGWHPMSYLNQGEFYSEFGSFDVRITLPENYIVGASGTLQNLSEIERLDRLAADTSWMDASYLMRDPFPPSSKQLKTLHYIADKMHDFAWFADKRFNVMTGVVKLPGSDREVTTRVMFTNRQSNLWKDALDYVNDLILWASEKIGAYPYEQFTAVQSPLSAGYGMEYPGITVIGIVEDSYSLDEVLAHEAIHNWFYGALGFNERRYPFLDEGLTSAYTARYMKEKYPSTKLWEVYFKDRQLARLFNIDHLPVQRMEELLWLMQARKNLEQPMNLPATEYSDFNYEVMLYYKAAMSFNYLRTYLGDSLFDDAMQDFYRKWKFSHPQPGDLRSVFEKHTDKDLSWFFEDLVGTTQRLDYKMVRIRDQELLIRNKGQLASPVVIAGMNEDSIVFEKWVDGFEEEKWIELPEGDYSEVKIDPNHSMPENFRMNNNINTTGSFPRADPIQTQFLFGLNDPEKHTIMYLPAINWKRENGFMAGALLHNGFIMPKPLEYLVMPFYAFGNMDLAGYGRIKYNVTPYKSFIRLATISLEGTQFGAPDNQSYRKGKIGLDLYFRKRDMTSPMTQKVFGNYIAATDLYQIKLDKKAKLNTYLQFGYMLERQSAVNPFTLLASIESGNSYQKLSVEYNYRLSYYGQDNGLEIRLFAGGMLEENEKVPFYSFAPAGRSGRELYLYQGTYPGRFADFPDNLWSRQMSLTEGGLVSRVNDSLGYSPWLVSLSLTSNLPGGISHWPFKPFVNLLLNEHNFGNANDISVFYEAGIKTGIWGLFEIYIPVLVSNALDNAVGPFKNRIRFVFSIDSFSEDLIRVE